jgi:WD40 repeat protein
MGGLGGAEIRETTTGMLSHRLVLKGLLTHLNISPDGRRVVAGADSGQCCVWDAQSGRPIIDPVQTTPSHYTAFSPDGRLFCVVTSKSTTHVFETESGRPAMLVMTNRHMGVSAIFTRDLDRLVVATDSGEVEFWSLPQGVRMESDVRHKDVVWTTTFSPDQRFLLTASGDRTAALWETATGRFVREFRHEQQVLTAAFSPDGQRIVTGDTTRHAFIWDAATGKRLVGLMQHPGSVWHAEFSTAGDVILTGDDTGNARLWDGATGLPLSGWVKNGPSLKRAHLSPDGRWALSAAETGTVRVWPVVYASLPAPQWLPDLAEALGGRRLKNDGTLEPVSPERLVSLTKSVSAGATDDLYVRWATWFFVERMNDKPLVFVP